MKLAESNETVKLVFNDQFDEVQNFLHLSDVFKDSRDISTTYLGTDTVMLKDHFVPECSFPIYSNSHTWGQLMGGTPDPRTICLAHFFPACLTPEMYPFES